MKKITNSTENVREENQVGLLRGRVSTDRVNPSLRENESKRMSSRVVR